ncbi:MAG: hypothetical protein CL535_16185 [Ahrensia sp.]|nr:hypothetical protein [Ahrensia sp.]MBV48212.1 hypothetical protein [Roseobacter sp.]|tara:strand:+ start:98388 stop:98627 length:240 start_codon:yes stop_codon:yes gene_type:complete
MTTAFALKEMLASKRQGKDVWFRFATVIGPCCTGETTERALFRSADDARNTEAFIHPLSFFEPVEVNAEDGGDFNWNAA